MRQLRAQLETGGWPRLQMLLLVMLTGASGFIASLALLALGVENMGLRYGLACGIAYLCFLGLLGIWIRWRKHDGFDLPDFPDLSSGTSGAPNSAPGWQGGGGSHGGGGASARFDAPSTSVAPAPLHASAPVSPRTPTVASEGSSVGSSGFDAPDLEAIPVLLVLLVLALVASSLFVVWIAPALLAELLLDAVLAAGLYRRLRHIERRHWLETALRTTAWPFLLTAVVVAGAGFALHQAVPHADSIGDVLEVLAQQRR